MTQSNERTVMFESAPIPKAVLQLAVPTVLTNLVTILYNLADTYFVGMLSDPVQNASIALAAPVTLAFNAVTNLFGVGTSSLMSRSLGSRKYEKVMRSSAFGFYSALFFSGIFALLCGIFMDPLLNLLGADSITRTATEQYLTWTVARGAVPAILNVVMAYFVRAEGAALHASIGVMSGCVINMILDPIFILPWGLNMGAEGAGCATFISNCLALCYFMVLLFVKRGKTFVCINPKKFGFDKEIVLGVFGVGIPASIQNLLNVASMTLLNSMAASFGPAAIAAFGIGQRICTVPIQVSMGLPQGVMPLVSYNFASGNSRRMKSAVFFIAKLMACIMLPLTVLFLLFPGFFIRIFLDEPEVVRIGAMLLSGISLAIPFQCMDFLAVNIFEAVGRGRNSLIFAIFRKGIFEIPAIFILNHFFPLYGLAYAKFTAEFLMAILAVVTLRYIFRHLDSAAAERDPFKKV